MAIINGPWIDSDPWTMEFPRDDGIKFRLLLCTLYFIELNYPINRIKFIEWIHICIVYCCGKIRRIWIKLNVDANAFWPSLSQRTDSFVQKCNVYDDPMGSKWSQLTIHWINVNFLSKWHKYSCVLLNITENMVVFMSREILLNLLI